MGIEKDLGAVSAYAIAVENGFTGTEEEWLESLIGPMGYQGWSVSAVRATTTGQLIFTVTDPHTGETKELPPVQADTVDALREIEAALGDAKKQVQKTADSASESAVKTIEGTQNTGVQAVGDAKTAAVEAVTSAQAAGVQAVNDVKKTAVEAVQGAQTTALNAITEAKTQATEAVGTAGNQALQDISDAKTSATGAVNTAGTQAVDAVNTAVTQAAENAETAITDSKNQAVSGVESAGQSAVEKVQEAQTAGVQAVDTAKNSAVQAVENAGTAETEKISGILPVPTETDAGKVPVAQTNGQYVLKQQIDDTKTALDTTWSSQNIVSRLCPPFELSGSIVTCNPVESSQLNVLVQIESVQEREGDPSPENVRLIRGWEAANVFRYGKNLFPNFIKDTDYPGGSTVKVNADGSITIHKVAGSRANQSVKIALPAGEYIIWNGLDSGNKIYLQIGWSTVATTLSTAAMTYKHSGGETDLYLYSDTQTTGDITLFPTLIPSGMELLYEPYHGETFTIPLGQTVYGGMLNVGSGTLIVTHANMTLTGELPWKTYNNGNEGLSFYFENEDFKEGLQTSICSHYKNVDFSWTSTNANKYGIYGDHSITNAKYFRPPDKDVTTLELFKEWLDDQKEAGTPVQLMYKLAEPITVQLTPQEILALSGVNTVYADAGDVTVSGYSDPNAIINALTKRISALEQNVIGG